PDAPATPGNVALWILLPACGSVALLATTNALCQDVAVVPLLWVLPLACYLVSFIVCFGSDRAYERAAFVPATALCLVALTTLVGLDQIIDFRVQIAVYCLALFGCCMLCHGELVRLRPGAARLTQFYLAMSAGGALGGLFVAVVAPLVFDEYHELPLALVATLALWLVAVWRDPRSALHRGRPRAAWAVLAALLLAYAGVNAQQVRDATVGFDSVARNFYGVLRTYTEPNEDFGDEQRVLLHGAVDHGFQFLSPENRRLPVAYYGPEAGVGVAARNLSRPGGRTLGVVGLGAGALAAYVQPGDRLRFYEINPLVIELARERFTYLAECPGTCEVVLGDARLVLEAELEASGGRGLGYDLLVLDAFSGDAPPTHLLTREAFALYLKHLAPDGVLAVNVSNSYVDLTPLVWRLAQEQGIEPLLFEAQEDLSRGVYDADWVLLARDRAWAEQPAVWEASVEVEAADLARFAEIRVWTDDYSNLLQLLLR
ncbi:MAG: fused MFS/spermidine synthase, partial [Myxococcales bacterium]|nr:fused MFS/spermidine synthase [Myxococcales bacterium]